jgi:hypothetical protein
MAISATFKADFTSFVDAVNRAETELKSFETGASKVEKSLQRMGDSFSGRRIIQDAQLAAKAIDDIGGVSKLTENELKRVSSQAQEAVAKLKAMGLEVPPGIQKIADATKNTGTAFEGLKGPLGNATTLLATFGVGISAAAVVGFGKAILGDADALIKLSDRTGIAVEGLQRLQVAGDDAGNTIEEMSGAVNQMQNRLASGDSSAIGALGKLRVSFDDIKGLAPDQQFMAISDALRQVDDPAQQVQIAMDLFGKTGASVLPTLKRGFDDVRDASVGMSRETARALDMAGDKLQEWTRKAKNASAEVIVTFGEALIDGLDPFRQMQREVAAQAEALSDALGRVRPPEAFRDGPKTFELTEVALKAFDRELEEERRAHEAAAAAARKQADELKRLAGELASAQANALQLESTIGRGTFTAPTPESGAADALAQARQRSVELTKAETLTGRSRTSLPTLQSGANPQLAALTQSFGKGLSDMLSTQMPQAILAAITGGGSKLEAIGSTFGSFLTSPKGFGGAISKGLTSVFGASFGGALNALIPGLGALMGPLLSAMGKKIKALFGGPSAEELGGRDLEKQFEQSFGSFDNMVNAIGEAYRATGKTSEDAQRDVKALLDAEKQGPAAVKAWIDKFNEAIEKSKALKDADAGAASAAIDAERNRIQSAIDGLTKQRDDLLGSIANEAPEEVMGVIEAGIRGQAAGIQAQIDKQQEEMNAISDQAADDLEKALGDIQPTTVHVPVVFDIPRLNLDGLGTFGPEVPGAATGARVLPFGLQHLAAGGFARRGTDTVPAMLTPGELVLNAAQQKNIAGALSSQGASVTVIVNNPSYDTPAGRQRALDATSRAIIEALKRERRLA